jgi:hypothetical protein
MRDYSNMERLVKSKTAKIQVIAMIAIFLQSCGIAGTNTASPSRSCGAKQVTIQVYDDHFQRVCGCQEGAGSMTSGLVCTFAVGSSVFFYYPAITGPHQISVGTAGTGTPIYRDPSTANPSTFVDVVLFNSAGSGAPAFSFSDVSTGRTGTFVVQ